MISGPIQMHLWIAAKPPFCHWYLGTAAFHSHYSSQYCFWFSLCCAEWRLNNKNYLSVFFNLLDKKGKKSSINAIFQSREYIVPVYAWIYSYKVLCLKNWLAVCISGFLLGTWVGDMALIEFFMSLFFEMLT